jgi:GDP-4-dehydro-6-deoxy-D-mannose reductase
MKYLVIGANGFIGTAVYAQLKKEGLDVSGAARDAGEGIDEIDLYDKKSIKKILTETKPDFIISCAGIVENSEKAILSNPIFTMNILQSVVELGLTPSKVLISGSAGEYGVVGHSNAVPESTALLAENNYARSKVMETSVALLYKKENNIPVFVYRPFNPIGPGMHPRFLIPNIINQIKNSNDNKAIKIEISRSDALRDYVDVRDIATAIVCLLKSDLKHDVYNIGSGKSVSNNELVNLIAKNMSGNKKVEIEDTQNSPEPLFAVKADTGRLGELGWEPSWGLEETISEIIGEHNG